MDPGLKAIEPRVDQLQGGPDLTEFAGHVEALSSRLREGRIAGDERPAPLLAHDQLFAPQDVEGVTNGHCCDAVVVGHPRVTVEPLARLEYSGSNLPPKVVGYLLVGATRVILAHRHVPRLPK